MVFLPRYSTAKARLRLWCVNIKLNLAQLLPTFTRAFQHCHHFIHVRTHVNITQQWKSTPTETSKAIELGLKHAVRRLLPSFQNYRSLRTIITYPSDKLKEPFRYLAYDLPLAVETGVHTGSLASLE